MRHTHREPDLGSFSVTLSLGLAEFPGDETDRHGLLKRADQALYCKARRQSRDRGQRSAVSWLRSPDNLCDTARA